MLAEIASFYTQLHILSLNAFMHGCLILAVAVYVLTSVDSVVDCGMFCICCLCVACAMSVLHIA